MMLKIPLLINLYYHSGTQSGHSLIETQPTWKLGKKDRQNSKTLVFVFVLHEAGSESSGRTIMLCHSRVQMGLSECALRKQSLLTSLIGKNKILWTKEGETHITKEHIEHTSEPHVCFSLPSESIAVLHQRLLFRWNLSHHHQPRWTMPLETSFFSNVSDSVTPSVYKCQYRHKSLEIQPSMDGIYLIMGPLKYKCGGWISNGLSWFLSRCKLSSLLLSSEAYLPGNSCLDPWMPEIFAYIAVSVKHMTW